MTPLHFRLLMAAIVIATLFSSCSKETPVLYSNPFDPESASYVPTAPGKLTAVAQADTGVLLTWNDLSNGEDGFIIERRIDGSGTFVEIDSLPANATEYFDHFIMKTGTNYYYRIKPVKENRSGDYTTDMRAFVNFPCPWQIVTTPLSSTSLKLVWSIDGNFPIEGYILERSVEGGSYAQLASLDKNAKSYIDTELDTTVAYRYRIKAFSRYNQGPYAQETIVEYSCIGIEKAMIVSLDQPVHSLAFSRDGKMFAASGGSYALRVWNTSDGKRIRDFCPFVNGYVSLGFPFPIAFSEDGSRIASIGLGGTSSMINIWSITDGSLVLQSHSNPGMNLQTLQFVNGNAEIVGGNSSGEIIILNIAKDSVRLRWAADIGVPIEFIHTTLDGQRLFTKSGWSIQSWSLRSGKELSRIIVYQPKICSISDDEQYFTTPGAAYRLSNGTVKASFASYTDGKSCFSSDNKHLLLRSGREIAVGRVADASLVASASSLNADRYTYNVIAASPNSNYFLVNAAESGFVEMWRMKRAWRMY